TSVPPAGSRFSSLVWEMPQLQRAPARRLGRRQGLQDPQGIADLIALSPQFLEHSFQSRVIHFRLVRAPPCFPLRAFRARVQCWRTETRLFTYYFKPKLSSIQEENG